jgi:hypothetical protein
MTGSWPLRHVSIPYAVSSSDNSSIWIPIDDDDTLHPDIADVLLEEFEDPTVEIVAWLTWKYDVTGYCDSYSVDGHNRMPMPHSNCYAIRGNVDQKRLSQHVRIKIKDVKCIDKILGLRTIHFGSIYLMRNRLIKFPSKIERSPMPLELNWASEIIDGVHELTSRAYSPQKVPLL